MAERHKVYFSKAEEIREKILYLTRKDTELKREYILSALTNLKARYRLSLRIEKYKKKLEKLDYARKREP
jgi:hypothetical protein